MKRIKMEDISKARLELLNKGIRADDLVIQMNYTTFEGLFTPPAYVLKSELKKGLKEGAKLFGMEIKINPLMNENTFFICSKRDYEYNKKLEDAWLGKCSEEIKNIYGIKGEIK